MAAKQQGSVVAAPDAGRYLGAKGAHHVWRLARPSVYGHYTCQHTGSACS